MSDITEHTDKLMQQGRLGEDGKVIPSWMLDEQKCARVEAIFKMYLQRVPILEIAQKFINPETGKPISIATVNREIQRGRSARAMIFTDNFKDFIQDQVEARRHIIRGLYEQIELLRAPYMEFNLETGQYESVPSDSSLIWTGLEAKVVVDIYKAIGEQEQAVESLLGMNKSRPSLINIEVGESSDVSVIQVEGDSVTNYPSSESSGDIIVEGTVSME